MPNTVLVEKIISFSNSNNWLEAKLEWKLEAVYLGAPKTCLCGHFPILEVCVIKNKITNSEVIVGNSCVKKFMNLQSDRIFQSIKLIKRELFKSVNRETIQYAYDHKWITEWEGNFYLSIMSKRKLTVKQKNKKIDVNQRILNSINR